MMEIPRQSTQETVQIYTEWANYYLERKSKRKIVDLSEDIRDGILLAELIEVVTSYKVNELTKKPKTTKQMHDNVSSCLRLLRQQEVGGLEDINAIDICAGRLKAILSLFFALSRHKQASKQRSAPRKPDSNVSLSPHHQHQTMQHPIERSTTATHTSIPVPSTILVQRRCAPDKMRPLPPTPNQSQTMGNNQHHNKKNSDNNSFDSYQNIMSTNKNENLTINEQRNKNYSSPYTDKNISTQYFTETTSTSTSQQTTISTTKHSGLLRLFKEKTPKTKNQTINTRASSSSGFSSAKSEKSDSSVSLHESHVSNKVKILPEKSSKKTKDVGSPKGKTKLLLSKSSKKSNKKENYSSVQHYSNTNITIIDAKGLTPKSIIPNKSKAQIKADNVESICESKRVEKGSEKTSNLLPCASNSQLPTAKPVATVKGTTKAVSENFVKEQETLSNKICTINTKTTNMSDSLNSSSTGIQSNSSESSVIYNPVKNELSTDIWQSKAASTYIKNPIPNRKINNLIDENNQNSFIKKSENEKNIDKKNVVLPMRSLLRGYNNRVTLPRGMKISHPHAIPEYCDDLRQQGYNSDSDTLINPPKRYSEIESGYVSEGGNAAMQFICMIRKRSQLPTTIEEKCVSTNENILEYDKKSMELQNNTKVDNEQEFWPSQDHNEGKQKNISQSHDTRDSQNYSKRSSPTTTQLKGVGRVKQISQGGRTALVSAVPRTNKIKISGGTQTATTDFQQKTLHHPQYRSFSLTGQGAAQLSQSMKERFGLGTRSLPKSGLDMHHFSYRMANRGPMKYDGSLSDTQTYAEVKPDYSTYSLWLNKSNTASRLSHQRDTTIMQSPRLNRSNSIRSTKSEKIYPTMLSRGHEVEIEPYYCLPVGANQNEAIVTWSQPTSPTPVARGINSILSPTNSGNRTISKKNDEVHGSQASLLSGGSSSLYGGSIEEKQFHEVRRLKRELSIAREQVMSLSSQLSTNAHVVSAFEQSLSNMTTRLQQLTATTEKKDSEILEMRQTIELLRKQSIQAGLTSAHMQSMGVNGSKTQQFNVSNNLQTKAQIKNTLINEQPPRLPLSSNESTLQRHLSSDSMCSLNSISSGCSTQEKKKKKGWLRSSFSKAFSRNAKISKTNRQISSQSSNIDISTQSGNLLENQPHTSNLENNIEKHITVVDNATPIDALDMEGNPIVEDLKKQLREKDLVLTDIRLEALSSASQLENLKETVLKMRQEMINLKQNNERLQKLITSRSLAGSDASLSVPLSPSDDRRYSLAAEKSSNLPVNTSEIEQMLDSQLNEMLSILQPIPQKTDERQTSIPLSPVKYTTHNSSIEPLPEVLDSTVLDDIPEGKKIAISVFLSQPECFAKYAEELSNGGDPSTFARYNENFDEFMDETKKVKNLSADENQSEFVISYTYISGKTTWQNLDYVVRRTFKEYLAKVDPGSNLGLNTDSISSYYLGEAKRGPEMGLPELLPCGYIVGHINTLYICLQGVSSLAFDSLIPRGIVNRYVNLLIEHRRLILCGPSGTGKSYLARKLAEFLIEKSDSDVIATFNVENKTNKELQQYLGHISEQATNGENELPSVIILENLHQANELGDVFSSLLNAGPKLPFLIATMSQSTCNATNLQLHHNFRWILLANHMDPVKGFLSRYLKRKLYILEINKNKLQPQLEAQLIWLESVWKHINSVLETHCSSDVTIGPRLFLDVPLDSVESEQFFINLWNTKLAPYIVEAVKEGIQLYGRRGAWIDPCTFIRESWPWPVRPTSVPKLKQITVEEIGLEGIVCGNNDNDPLLEMLMRLQEAANCNGNKDDSDCESNMTHDSSAGLE